MAFPDSSTRLAGLFGYPVRHSVSPQIQNAAFRAADLNWLYLAFCVPPGDLEAAFRGCLALGFCGLNITIPHKQTVIPLLNELSEEARLIGAVNTVAIRKGKACGYNTDGRGLVAALGEETGSGLGGKMVFVLGAGGAGRAVAVQAGLEKAGLILVADLKRARAGALAALLDREFGKGLARRVEVGSRQWREGLGAAEVVVNATPLGMGEEDPPGFDPDLLSPSALVVDLVYNPPETKLLKAVRKRGGKGMNGLGMLVHQAALAWEIWTGRKAPLEVMRRAARKALSR